MKAILYKSKQAFTVLELLVATAVLTVIMTILFNVFSRTSDTWQAGESNVDLSRNVRVGLDFMSRELSQAMVNTNAAGPLRFIGKPQGVYFVGSVPLKSTYNSDLAEFGYHYDAPPGGSSNVFRLFSPPDPAHPAYGKWAPRNLGSTPLTNDFMYAGAVSEVVWSFDMRYFNEVGTPFTEWDSEDTDTSKLQHGKVPSAIEIKMSSMDRFHFRRLPTAPAAFITFTNQHLKSFSTVIHLQGSLP
jgi:hypothetical protein